MDQVTDWVGKATALLEPLADAIAESGGNTLSPVG